jgi:HSP20 family protein
MPWDPVRDLLTMQERLEGLFGSAAAGWVPAADLCETRDDFILTIELPGLGLPDVDITFASDTLTVSGRRPEPASCERYQQFERAQGTFSRSFRFAVPVDHDRISADLADGVLTVTVHKTAVTAARRIEVE